MLRVFTEGNFLYFFIYKHKNDLLNFFGLLLKSYLTLFPIQNVFLLHTVGCLNFEGTYSTPFLYSHLEIIKILSNALKYVFQFQKSPIIANL